ncbi:ATP-binding protein [Maledivibacter halophilus]|uniref:MinD superfamily P-loop ATPase, contains an inserted ferredoxin domain n=1 Tax=Maledivibacter halophilus TaxID=36842 RepID=A0A1T5LLU7_9FIRM|nr:ATP-binding protein [Maledivibacter halophilus]SKC76993.1 MinD superfamily P-loop ATPase, contains an inserted ferredoxin domain [Maledivibacter halophilus]
MDINEIVVISGKGGTGKTTLVSSIVPFLKDLVIADCDVDAPDLNILFGDKIKHKQDFVGLQRAVINKDICINCGKCHKRCKFNAIAKEIIIDTTKCEGCGVCEYVCPVNAVEMKDSVVGKIFVSNTEYGDMVHARLIPGEETSGKLVAEVRKKAKKIATEKKMKNIIIDGSPGIACNVIASLTGVNQVIIVIEPTLSGLHDLKKVHEMVKRFRLSEYIVINKYDISEDELKKIEDYCNKENLEIVLKIPFNKKLVEAITKKAIPSLYEREFFENIGFYKFLHALNV